MSEPQPLLSPAGEQRRRQILDAALAQARGRRRRRVLTRVTLAALLLALLVPPILRFKPAHNPRIVVKRIEPPHPTAPRSPAIVVTLIKTDPHVIERLAIPPHPLHVVVINDAELLTGLAMAHHPAGLVYVDGKARLMFR